MEYPSYLIHFNPRHNPKTGRFDFALPGEKMQSYGGKSRREYKKEMSERYQKEGNSKFKSDRLANYAAKANNENTRQYNVNLRSYQNEQKKALTAYDKHDEAKYVKHAQKLVESYRYAKLSDKMVQKDYELGKALYKPLIVQIANDFTFGGLVGATAKAIADFKDMNPNKWTDSDSFGKIHSDTYKEVYNEMAKEYAKKNKGKSLDDVITLTKFEEFMYGNPKEN